MQIQSVLKPGRYSLLAETTVRGIGKDRDVTPLCSNATLDEITSIICKIKTKGSRGEGCRLLYGHGRGFEHECDSRFTLMKQNQRVFLQLINLTAEDSGKITCECSHGSRTDILQLLISEEGVRLYSDTSYLCVFSVFSNFSLVIYYRGSQVSRENADVCHCD